MFYVKKKKENEIVLCFHKIFLIIPIIQVKKVFQNFLQGVPGAVRNIFNLDSTHQNKNKKFHLTWILKLAVLGLGVLKVL